MSDTEDKMVERLEELNMPEFIIQDAIDILSTEEEQQKLLDFIKEGRKYGEVARKIARISVESGYGEDIDDKYFTFLYDWSWYG